MKLACFALLGLFFFAAPHPAAAGANETPGRNYRPHAFGAFLANQFEFGATDLAIFQEIVVGSQHYRQGSVYSDNDAGNGLGSGGVWNFFTFCTNRAHDVMLLTSHGRATPLTLVEIYPHDEDGLAARDASLEHWNGIFAAGSFVGTESDARYSISATQTFYTTYFQTPQALCWWATCYSSALSMTGGAEARDFLGYDDVVTTGKCNCDQRYVLSRMDGQSGQALRPLAAALAGVNATCPVAGDNKAKLVHSGAGNTVLSPSVIAWAPTGVVCSTTPGFVKFDTTMDTRVPPGNVVVAFGGGILINHQWAGDDQVTFTVVPIVPCPTILYDVIESQARSKADMARLDGNIFKAGNAVGPNQDDFIWLTNCPCWPWIPYDVPDLVEIPDPSPGQPTVVYTPVTNHQQVDANVQITFEIPGVAPPSTVSQTIAASSTALVSWPVTIPTSAEVGQSYPMQVVVDDGSGPHVFSDQLVVQDRFEAALVEGSTLAAGQINHVSVVLWPRSLEPWTDPSIPWFFSLQSDQPWPVDPVEVGLFFPDFSAQILDFTINVPPGVAAGTQVTFTLHVAGPPPVTDIAVGTATVGLPIQITPGTPVDVVPGNHNALIPIELVSLSLVSVTPVGQANATHGFPVQVQLPPTLFPNVPQQGYLIFDIPPDPALVGQSGTIDLTISDGSGHSMSEQVPYVIEPAIEVTPWEVSLHTGYAVPHGFPWLLTLRNRADVPLSGQLIMNSAGLLVSPPVSTFSLPPAGEVVRNLTLTVPAGLAAGLYPATAIVQNSQQIGSQSDAFEHRVQNPVEPYIEDRAVAGIQGEILPVTVEIQNHRPDQAMTGTYQFSDAAGWIVDGASANYNLGPGQSTPVTAHVLCGSGRSESDSLWIQVNQTYDNGTQAQAYASTEIVSIQTAGTPEPTTAPRGDELALEPNPFSRSLAIRFALAGAEPTRITAHDAGGRTVAVLADRRFEAGVHQITWDGRGAGGVALPVGVYFVHVDTPNRQWTRKAVLVN